jgi:MFS family permease
MDRRAHAAIIAGFFTVSIAYSIRYGYGMLLPEMLSDLAISKTEAGVIFSTYFLAYTLATPVLGALSDRFNYRYLLSLFTMVMAIGALLMAYVADLIQAVLFYSFAGLGHAACWAPVTALVQKWVPDRKRGTALSIVTMGVGFGIPLWSLLLPKIVGSAGWRTGWFAMGLLGLIVAVLNFFLVRNPVNTAADDRTDEPSILQFWSSYWDLLTDRTFWVIGTAYLFVGFNVIIPFTFLPVYAREVLTLPYEVSTRFVALIALSGVVGQFTLGPLSDRVGRVRVMVLCGLIMGMACPGMALVPDTFFLYAFTICYGFGYGAVWPVYAAAATDFFSRKNTGGIVGLWTVFLGVGSIVSPVVCGWSIDTSGRYVWVFMLGLASGVLSSVLLLFGINRRKKKK